METRKYVLSQTLSLFTGELVLSALMAGIFALLGDFDRSVLLGAAAGTLIATANHLLLALGVVAASNRAEKQDVKGGQAAIQLSYMGRFIGLFLILVLCTGSGRFNLPTLVIPLLFTRPILAIMDRFDKKKGGTNP